MAVVLGQVSANFLHDRVAKIGFYILKGYKNKKQVIWQILRGLKILKYLAHYRKGLPTLP